MPGSLGRYTAFGGTIYPPQPDLVDLAQTLALGQLDQHAWAEKAHIVRVDGYRLLAAVNVGIFVLHASK